MEAYEIISGRVGTEPESRSTAGGHQVASFRLGSTPRLRRQGQWGDGETSWVSVLAYRALAENITASLHKGDPVVVFGRKRTQVWMSEGERHERVCIEALSVGHDLNWGASSFEPKERTVREEEPESEVREVLTALEAKAEQEAAAEKAGKAKAA